MQDETVCVCSETIWNELCFFTEYPELHQSSNRYAWRMVVKYAEWNILHSEKTRNETVYVQGIFGMSCAYLLNFQKYLTSDYPGEFETNIENILVVIQELRWVLWAKQVESKKTSCKCTFQGSNKKQGASVNRFSLKDFLAGTFKKKISNRRRLTCIL